MTPQLAQRITTRYRMPDVGGCSTSRLYPAQRIGVDRFLHSGAPRRFILPWKTGCGKTAAALTAMVEAGCPRVLIVCPAIVRNHWLTEMEKWCPPATVFQAAIIEWGRERKLSKRREALKAEAYQSPIQIVSYDLLHEVDQQGWDLIIFDELHHLAQPLSRQSRAAAEIVEANTDADILGLSATLIPTEVAQLWNPLRLLFGERAWGRASRTKDVSWDFIFKYCNIEKNDYGTGYYGLKEDSVDELRAKLATVTYPLAREDIAANLPPLDAQLYQLPKATGKHALRDQLIEWHDSLGPDVTHRVIMVRHRELAWSIYNALPGNDRGIVHVDGETVPCRRINSLVLCERADAATLVCTYESLNEGVRLMWPQQVAIAEWPMSPGPMTQLLGRFNSVGSDARPQVSLMCHSDTYGAAKTLLTRTQAVMQTLGAAKNETELIRLLEDSSNTDISSEEWLTMFASQHDTAYSEDPDECDE